MKKDEALEFLASAIGDSVDDEYLYRAFDILNNAPQEQPKSYSYEELSEQAKLLVVCGEHMRAKDHTQELLTKSLEETPLLRSVHLALAIVKSTGPELTLELAGTGVVDEDTLEFMYHYGLPNQLLAECPLPDSLVFAFTWTRDQEHPIISFASQSDREQERVISEQLSQYLVTPIHEKVMAAALATFDTELAKLAEERKNNRYSAEGFIV